MSSVREKSFVHEGGWLECAGQSSGPTMAPKDNWTDILDIPTLCPLGVVWCLSLKIGGILPTMSVDTRVSRIILEMAHSSSVWTFPKTGEYVISQCTSLSLQTAKDSHCWKMLTSKQSLSFSPIFLVLSPLTSWSTWYITNICALCCGLNVKCPA